MRATRPWGAGPGRRRTAAGGPALPLAELAVLVTATGAGRLEIRTPFDGSVLGTVPRSDIDDVAEAIRRARAAQVAWAARSPRSRAEVMHRFARLVLDRRDSVLDLIQLESGKSRLDALEEVLDASRTAAHYAHAAPDLLRPQRRAGAVPVLTRTLEVRSPKGVVGVISPWNYPFTLAVSDAVPALLAGNGVVLKPDSRTPFAALLGVSLLRAAGLPGDLLQVVVGPGAELGAPIIDGVDHVMFTGSTATGRLVASRCATRLVDVSAELGGKNPLIVLADADLRSAAIGAVRAAFASAGQLCIGVERIYVEQSVHRAFLERFLAVVARMRLGVGLAWDLDMGTLVSARQLERVSDLVADAVARGATVLAGGRPRPDLAPWYYEPTVLADVPDDARLTRTEAFGPVVSVQPVADLDEAVALANASDYGLSASVWTSGRRGEAVARRLEVGTVNVNEAYAAAWASHAAPMGGWKDSGMGRRHGVEGLLKFTESRTIATQRLLPLEPPPGRPGAARVFAAGMTPAIRLLDRFR